mmetsp:Transcript_17397/g.43300  ORF Transcript_17397/g.43300 Transcript_17397/m.43300 type:complete len:347 (+) Transcript_17397:160-1200(+)
MEVVTYSQIGDHEGSVFPWIIWKITLFYLQTGSPGTYTDVATAALSTPIADPNLECPSSFIYQFPLLLFILPPPLSPFPFPPPFPPPPLPLFAMCSKVTGSGAINLVAIWACAASPSPYASWSNVLNFFASSRSAAVRKPPVVCFLKSCPPYWPASFPPVPVQLTPKFPVAIAIPFSQLGASLPLVSSFSRISCAFALLRLFMKVTAIPLLPILPVRPIRCTKSSELCAQSYCTTNATSGMSSPRAATSVAIITGQRFDLKSARAASRWRWSLSPWMDTVRMFILARKRSSSVAAFLVFTKTSTSPISRWCKSRPYLRAIDFQVFIFDTSMPLLLTAMRFGCKAAP